VALGAALAESLAALAASRHAVKVQIVSSHGPFIGPFEFSNTLVHTSRLRFQAAPAPLARLALPLINNNRNSL
jgi:hypothetical protein